MYSELMKRVIEKHGDITFSVDKMGRFIAGHNMGLIGSPSFSIGSLLISILGEDKK